MSTLLLTLQMQIRHKQSKKALAEKAATVRRRAIAFEKSKQKIDDRQVQLHELKEKVHSSEKAVVMRDAYLERLDEQMYSKEDEVDALKNILKNKDDPSQILEGEANGPDVMEVRFYIYTHVLRWCMQSRSNSIHYFYSSISTSI